MSEIFDLRKRKAKELDSKRKKLFEGIHINDKFKKTAGISELNEAQEKFKKGRLIAEDYGDEIRISIGSKQNQTIWIPKEMLSSDFINWLSRSI